MKPEGSLPHSQVPTVPILSQLDPVHTPTSNFLKIHPNIILSSTPGSPKWSLSLRFPHQNHVYDSALPHTYYMACPSHLDFMTRTILGEKCRSLSPSFCSCKYCPKMNLFGFVINLLLVCFTTLFSF